MKTMLVILSLTLSLGTFATPELAPSEKQSLIDTLNGEETTIKDFLEASKEAAELNDEGRQCRVICFPCCYGPRGCTTICDG